MREYHRAFRAIGAVFALIFFVGFVSLAAGFRLEGANDEFSGTRAYIDPNKEVKVIEGPATIQGAASCLGPFSILVGDEEEKGIPAQDVGGPPWGVKKGKCPHWFVFEGPVDVYGEFKLLSQFESDIEVIFARKTQLKIERGYDRWHGAWPLAWFVICTFVLGLFFGFLWPWIEPCRIARRIISYFR